MFDGDATLMQLEGNDLVDHVAPPSTYMEDRLALNVDAKMTRTSGTSHIMI